MLIQVEESESYGRLGGSLKRASHGHVRLRNSSASVDRVAGEGEMRQAMWKPTSPRVNGGNRRRKPARKEDRGRSKAVARRRNDAGRRRKEKPHEMIMNAGVEIDRRELGSTAIDA